MDTVREVAGKIQRLEVKGARNVAIAALEAIGDAAEKTRARNRTAFLVELSEARQILFASRPTEPLMRNALNWVAESVEHCKKRDVGNLSQLVVSNSRAFLRNLEESRKEIAEIGAKRICIGMTVFTHCHSSTVTNLLKLAKEIGTSFEVICTETRPAFQGRITAEEMTELGIKTTLIVDSAARTFIRRADLVIVGADAITSEGNVVNKIGSATIAVLANEARVPFYVASELLKFDSTTLRGEYEPIEERGRHEVWKEAPETLSVRNPAFDVTRREFIQGIICEEGVIPPHIASEVVRRRYPWIFGKD